MITLRFYPFVKFGTTQNVIYFFISILIFIFESKAIYKLNFRVVPNLTKRTKIFIKEKSPY